MVTLTNGNDIYLAGPEDDVISGLEGNDDIRGSGQVDTIFGNAGDDYLKGLAANDILSGDAGDDVLRADEGDDTLYGGAGADVLYGGNGHDYLAGGDSLSADFLFGGNGHDTLISNGSGMAVGGNGDDTITSSVLGSGQVHMWAQAGDDTLNLDMANNTGTQGHHAYGGSGSNSFNFTNLGALSHLSIGRIDDFDASRDTITLGGVTLHGDGASLADLPRDLTITGVGTVRVQVVEYQQTSTGPFDLGTQQFLAFGVVDGGSVNWLGLYALEGARRNGADTEEVHFIEKGQVTSDDIDAMRVVTFVDQENFVPVGPTDVLASNEIETQAALIDGTSGADGIFAQDALDPTDRENTINGFEGDDVINSGKAEDVVYGGSGDDSIAGGLDNDSLYGGADDDTIYGGSEDDLIYGGDGNDVLRGAGEDDVLFGGSGNDKLSGSSGNDRMYGGGWADTLYGGEGEDILSGGHSDDLLYAGADNDMIYGGDGNDSLRGWHGSDTLFGGIGDDQMDGGVYDDNLFGGNGRDVLIGNDGNDYLDGGKWSDALYGGAGSDKLIGGGAADTFVFEENFRSDRILDFSADDAEKIDVSAVADLSDFADVMDHIYQNKAGHAVIDLGDGNKITIEGYGVADFGTNGLISAEDFVF